ncbi:uncharacterized protein TNCV_1157451 [Trichonephila clavipes]|nr:uncharacterized protein TNCV_1157451 [Trichonephila clavipes]
MGARLRALKNNLKSTKLSDNKPISGRGRLTDAEILLLQKYYGLAIRRNVGKSVADMSKSIWAIYFHKLSTDENPQHALCPMGERSWCRTVIKMFAWPNSEPQQKALIIVYGIVCRKTFVSKRTLQMGVMDVVTYASMKVHMQELILKALKINQASTLVKALVKLTTSEFVKLRWLFKKLPKKPGQQKGKIKENRGYFKTVNARWQYSAGF